MINSIGSVFQPESVSAAQSADKLFTANSTTYLQLFLTQMKYQNPTEPIDTKDMTAQLSQLTNSQQLIEMNKNFEKLISMQSNNSSSTLATFINRQVTFLSNDFMFDGNYVSEIGYGMEKDYSKTNIEVLDGNGTVIYRTEGEKKAGSYTFTWSGETTSGAPAPAGRYSIRINGQNSDGQYEQLPTTAKGVVSGIDYASSSEPLIRVGNGEDAISVPLSNIAVVQNAYL